MPASPTSRPRSAWFSFPAPRSCSPSRRRVAEIYNAHLSEHPLLQPPYVPEGLEPNWQSYQVMVREAAALTRNEIMDRLFQAGVPTRRGVMASHLEPPYRGTGARLPNTERVAANSSASSNAFGDDRGAGTLVCSPR